jgi:VIT1/CCC1 family predicted Fe2+/Mn2+ transporter
VGINVKIHDKALRLHSVVVSANDGITTTFAVVAGALGASLSPSVVLILGFANLFADGLSMATGSYLGVKAEIEFEEGNGQDIKVGNEPLKNALTTFISFFIAGLVPLLPYLFNLTNSFTISCVFVVSALFAVGLLRGKYTNKKVLKTGIENTLIGGMSAVLAYIVGFLVRKYLI